MGNGISEVLTFAVGVAISLVPIIAVILMLFSQRARVNGPVFLLGWVVALAVVSGVAYVVADQTNASTSNTTSDTISWGKHRARRLSCSCVAARNWRNRPAPGDRARDAEVDGGHRRPLAGKGVRPRRAAGRREPQEPDPDGRCGGWARAARLSTSEAVVSLIVFVVIASLTIAGPVVYYLLGGDTRRRRSTS